ncbi:hypothetical protein PybrP1_001025, partial [[Pythium] brassicae (nom. inval.)]
MSNRAVVPLSDAIVFRAPMQRNMHRGRVPMIVSDDRETHDQQLLAAESASRELVPYELAEGSGSEQRPPKRARPLDEEPIEVAFSVDVPASYKQALDSREHELCAAIGYIIEQMDVDTAYLNAKLDEVVYMEPPTGLEIDGDVVCRLNKSLYGLKQSAHAWNKTIHAALLEMEFAPCGGDKCVYAAIRARFKTKDLGAVRYLLGMEIKYNMANKTLRISQQQYVRDLVGRFNQ